MKWLIYIRDNTSVSFMYVTEINHSQYAQTMKLINITGNL